MNATTASATAQVSPELAEKLQQVERDFERLHSNARSSQRWSLLGLIPRLAQVVSLLALFFPFVGIALYFYASSITKNPAHMTPLSEAILRFFGSIVGAALSLLISTWAYRYCQARADGKL